MKIINWNEWTRVTLVTGIVCQVSICNSPHPNYHRSHPHHHTQMYPGYSACCHIDAETHHLYCQCTLSWSSCSRRNHPGSRVPCHTTKYSKHIPHSCGIAGSSLDILLLQRNKKKNNIMWYYVFSRPEQLHTMRNVQQIHHYFIHQVNLQLTLIPLWRQSMSEMVVWVTCPRIKIKIWCFLKDRNKSTHHWIIRITPQWAKDRKLRKIHVSINHQNDYSILDE